MLLNTDEHFLNQTDELFKCLNRLRHKHIRSKTTLNKLKECIANLYVQTNTRNVKEILTKACRLTQELEKQADNTKKSIDHKPIRKIKRYKQLAKNIGGKSP